MIPTLEESLKNIAQQQEKLKGYLPVVQDVVKYAKKGSSKLIEGERLIKTITRQIALNDETLAGIIHSDELGGNNS